jgi:extradiol dioxygenase family protein
MIKNWLSSVFFFLVFILNANAEQGDDTQFLVLGKTANYRQTELGEQSMLNYHFFAEIFVKEGAKITEGTLNNPDIDQMKFSDDATVLETHGGRYGSETDLDSHYPNGEYIFRYLESDGSTLNIPVILSNKQDGKTRIPKAPIISLYQNGEIVSSNNINPAQDLIIAWTPFTEGAKDENGYVDDLIFAFVANCKGEKISHSGVPFGGGPHLTFADNNYRIDKTILESGHTYQIAVEHAVMDTDYVGIIPTIATYASTSFLDFETLGENQKPQGCSSMPIQMDKGQTDRSLSATMDLPKIDEQITMLYYSVDDFDKAVEFYGGDLHLKATFDDQWVKIYALTDSAFIGVVKDSDGGFHKPNKDSAVMVSIVSKAVDDWYGAIKNAKNIKIEHEIYNSSTAPIRAFLIRDPGGYTVEFFQWMK